MAELVAILPVPVFKTFLVAIGGALGSVLRYGVTGVVHRLYGGTFPLGTFTVNAIGCFVVGCLLSLSENRQALSPEVRVFVAAGVIGGFTTFSAFGFETIELVRKGAVAFAFANVGLNVGLGLIAVWLGIQAGKVL